MHRTARPALAVALVAVLALSCSCSSDDDPGSAPSPSTGATSSTSPSGSTSASSASASSDAAASNEVATLLGRNLEAYKKATGSYPKGGSQAYQSVVGIDQARGFTIAYSVDGAGRMIVCVSDQSGSASYDSKDRAVTDGEAQGCGV